MGRKYSKEELPEEIVFDILSRLPVESLLRFRCVCKPWLALISDPKFITEHLNHRKNHPEKDWLLHISRSRDFFRLNRQSSVLTALSLKFPQRHDPDFSDQFWGTYDGLLLLSAAEGICLFLVNPSTRELKFLPHLPLLVEGIQYVARYALGYDMRTKTYKILAILQLRIGTYSEYMVFLYNLGASSWRRIEKVPDSLSRGTSKGVYLNTCLHWLMDDYQKEMLGVTCFDLGDESFSSILFPVSVRGTCDFEEVGVLGDCLCVFGYDRGLVVMWVLKEYGVADSWTKFIVRYDEISEIPLCSLRTSKVVISDGHKLYFVNPEDEEGEELEVEGIFYRPMFSRTSDTTPYTESLVRLDNYRQD